MIQVVNVKIMLILDSRILSLGSEGPILEVENHKTLRRTERLNSRNLNQILGKQGIQWLRATLTTAKWNQDSKQGEVLELSIRTRISTWK